MIYLFIFVLLVVLSIHYDINGRKKGKTFFYYFVLAVMVLVAGLRWRIGADTPNYLYHFYYDTPLLSNFTFRDYSIGTKPLWIILNSIVLTLGGRFYVVQLIQSLLVNFFIFKYLKKHTNYLFSALVFYYLIVFIPFNFETMKASLSIVSCMYANDFFLKKRWIKGLCLVLLGSLFHFSALIFVITPLLCYLRLNKTSTLILFGSFFIGFFVRDILDSYMSVFDFDEAISHKMSGYYEQETYSGQTGTIIKVLVSLILYFVIPLYSFVYIKRNNPKANIIIFEPFLIVGLIFELVQVNCYIFGRFIQYYYIYFVIFEGHAIAHMAKRLILLKTNMKLKIVAILLPLFVCVFYSYKAKLYRYYPYSSVIERSIDVNRERAFLYSGRPRADRNQY